MRQPVLCVAYTSHQQGEQGNNIYHDLNRYTPDICRIAAPLSLIPLKYNFSQAERTHRFTSTKCQ